MLADPYIYYRRHVYLTLFALVLDHLGPAWIDTLEWRMLFDSFQVSSQLPIDLHPSVLRDATVVYDTSGFPVVNTHPLAPGPNIGEDGCAVWVTVPGLNLEKQPQLAPVFCYYPYHQMWPALVVRGWERIASKDVSNFFYMSLLDRVISHNQDTEKDPSRGLLVSTRPGDHFTVFVPVPHDLVDNTGSQDDSKERTRRRLAYIQNAYEVLSHFATRMKIALTHATKTASLSSHPFVICFHNFTMILPSCRAFVGK
jgi:hypothetical protein